MKEGEGKRQSRSQTEIIPPPLKNGFELMVILWCVCIMGRGGLYLGKKRKGQRCVVPLIHLFT